MSELQTLELVSTAEPIKANNAVALVGPFGMALQAINAGVSLSDLRDMLEMQKEWEKREAEKAFRVDFAAFRGANIIIPKNKLVTRGNAGSFHQAEYDEVCRRISPALSEHGLSFRHDQKFGSRKWTTDGVESDVPWVYVTCYLEHKSGHAETLTLEGPPGDLSANTATQNMQVTASYLKRQSLLAITGTATGGEDDENHLRDSTKHDADDGGEGANLCNQGRDASMNGMESLTKWWGSLTPHQRSDLNNDFPAMRKAAQSADKGVAA